MLNTLNIKKIIEIWVLIIIILSRVGLWQDKVVHCYFMLFRAIPSAFNVNHSYSVGLYFIRKLSLSSQILKNLWCHGPFYTQTTWKHVWTMHSMNGLFSCLGHLQGLYFATDVHFEASSMYSKNYKVACIAKSIPNIIV